MRQTAGADHEHPRVVLECYLFENLQCGCQRFHQHGLAIGYFVRNVEGIAHRHRDEFGESTGVTLDADDATFGAMPGHPLSAKFAITATNVDVGDDSGAPP